MVEGPDIPDTEEMIWVGDMTRQASHACPDHPAIIMPEKNVSLSYLELERRIDRAVYLLRDEGLQPGDCITYLGKNHALFYILMFAAIRGDFIIVPLNWRCVATEIRYFLEDSAAGLLFCDPELSAMAKEAMASLSSPPELLSTEASEEVHGKFVKQLEEPLEVSPVDTTRTNSNCLLLYTSGTSGRPKGVLSSHFSLSISRQAELVYEYYPDWQEGKIVSSMPHFHIAGIAWMMIGLIRRSTCVLTADPSGANLTRLLREHDALATFAVPTVVRAIVDEVMKSKQPIPSLKYIFYGAAPIGQSLLETCMDTLGCRFGQYYGMTEITGSATFLDPNSHNLDRPDLMQSIGRPLPGVAVDIRDDKGNSLPAGVSGEIWIRTPTLMEAYWQKPDETANAVVDGWYRSGDGGYFTEEGYLFLTDRVKDIIVSGGENIYPAEVEEALRQHPSVLDVAVVAKPDERWGESVIAVVETLHGEGVDAETLTAFIRARLAGFKCPKALLFVDSLPRTASGKVQRGKAREAALQQLAAQRILTL